MRALADARRIVVGMAITSDQPDTFYIGYWPGEGGAQPYRVRGTGELAVWDTAESAAQFGLLEHVNLQVVSVSSSLLAFSQEAISLNPKASQ
jgi:hypothetical protein